MAPPSSPSRSSRLSSVSSIFSRSKTKAPAENKTKPQDLNKAQQKAPMEQQGAKVEHSRGVRFEGVNIGKGCAITIVSTQGGEVYGKEIDVQDYSSFHSGQMSEESVQALPRACSPAQSSTENQSNRAAQSSRRGVGRVLGVAASNGAGAERPT